MFTVMFGIGGVVDVTHQRFGYHRHIAILFLDCALHFPRDLGQVGGHAAQDLAVEQLDDLRPPLASTTSCGGDALAVVEHERVGQIGIHIGLRLVVVGVHVDELGSPSTPGRSCLMPSSSISRWRSFSEAAWMASISGVGVKAGRGGGGAEAGEGGGAWAARGSAKDNQRIDSAIIAERRMTGNTMGMKTSSFRI